MYSHCTILVHYIRHRVQSSGKVAAATISDKTYSFTLLLHYQTSRRQATCLTHYIIKLPNYTVSQDGDLEENVTQHVGLV
jgi:hypothetical protein